MDAEYLVCSQSIIPDQSCDVLYVISLVCCMMSVSRFTVCIEIHSGIYECCDDPLRSMPFV